MKNARFLKNCPSCWCHLLNLFPRFVFFILLVRLLIFLIALRIIHLLWRWVHGHVVVFCRCILARRQRYVVDITELIFLKWNDSHSYYITLKTSFVILMVFLFIVMFSRCPCRMSPRFTTCLSVWICRWSSPANPPSMRIFRHWPIPRCVVLSVVAPEKIGSSSCLLSWSFLAACFLSYSLAFSYY